MIKEKLRRAITNLFLIGLLVFIGACQKNEVDSEVIDYEEISIQTILPCESQELGETFAFRVNEIIKQNPNILKSTASNLKSLSIEREKKIPKFEVSSFSEKQWEVIGEIAKSLKESNSISEFQGKQLAIALDLKDILPTEERTDIYNIIAVLYYGLEQIDYSNLTDDSQLKSLSGPIPMHLLEYIWCVALAEPSPVGEIVAILVTAGVASYYVLTRSECIEYYVDCVNPHGDFYHCSTCLQRCIVQGNWDCY